MQTTALVTGTLLIALTGACGDSIRQQAAQDTSAASSSGLEQSGGQSSAIGGARSDGGSVATGGRSATTGGDSDASAGSSAGAAGDLASAGADSGSGGRPDASRGGSPAQDVDLHGFSVRSPEERTVTCSQVPPGMPSEPAVLSDEDFVCTFAHGDTEGYVYVQATPTDCQVLMGPVPTTFEAAGWLSVNDVASTIEVEYSHGGNHANSSFEFVYADHRYEVNHSSIGYGGRACQPPDCLRVYASDGDTLQEDGCTTARTLPVTCAQVETGGVVPALQASFLRCPGDPNYE
ncbi:hypothetical protein ACFL5O_06040 [Myxococcota bacterium]